MFFRKIRRKLEVRAHRRKISREERPWLELNETEFWLLARQDLVAQQLYLRRAFGPSAFSDEEIRRKQQQIQSTVKADSEPNGGFRSRWKLTESMSAVRSLFTPKEVQSKLAPELVKLDRRFRGKMKASLKSFKQYRDIVKHLPDEAVEHEIASLKEKYLVLGFRREWYSAYKDMIEQVVRESTHGSFLDGQNEPAVRILQEDFVQTMLGRVSTYKRFQALRTYCFQHQLSAEIDLIERTRAGLGRTERLIRDPVPFTDIENLCNLLTANQVEHESRPSDPIAEADMTMRTPEERLADFAALQVLIKQSHNKSESLLKQLSLVTSQHQGWQLAFAAFEAEIRLASVKLNPAAVHHKTINFAREISQRIEQELIIDIEFQGIVVGQETLMDSQLTETMDAIQLQYASFGAAALDAVHQIKDKLVRDQAESRENKVTPLFRR